MNELNKSWAPNRAKEEKLEEIARTRAHTQKLLANLDKEEAQLRAQPNDSPANSNN